MAKYVSEFVRKQRILALRAKKARKGVVVWDSLKYGTYVRAKQGVKYGELISKSRG